MSIAKQIAASEQRVKALGEKLALRQSQQAHDTFLSSLRKTLSEEATELLKLRLAPGGGWDALDVLRRLGLLP